MTLRKLTTAEKRWVRSLMQRGHTRNAAVRIVQQHTQQRPWIFPRGTSLHQQEKLRIARLHWKEPTLPGRWTHEDFRRWMRVGWDFGNWDTSHLP